MVMTLFLKVVVSSGSLPWPSSHITDLFHAATAVLNSWNSVSCFENLVVLVHHLGVQRLVHTFSDFASASDCSMLRNCGCPFHASLQRAICVRIST